MQKDRSYHEAAIQYNDEIAAFADGLSQRLEHEEVARWARSVAKQHKFHAGRHRRALAKMDAHNVKTVNTEDGGEDRVVDDEHIVHRSAVSGEYVTEEFADSHPRTTVEETVEDVVPQPGADEDVLRSPEGEVLDPQEPTVVPADSSTGEEA